MFRAFPVNRLFFSALFVAGVYPAAALAVPTCQTGSLGSYVALDEGGGCSLGDFTFFRFTDPTPTITGSPTVASDSQILVTPILNGTTAGFSFSAVVNGVNLFSISSPSGTTAVTYYINYSVDPAPVIDTADLSMDPPFGDASASQVYCTSDVLVNNCALGTKSQQTVTVSSPNSALTFSNPSSFVDIQTDISLVATPGNPAGLDSVNATVTEASGAATPEPANVLLTGLAGLLALPLFLSRRKRA